MQHALRDMFTSGHLTQFFSKRTDLCVALRVFSNASILSVPFEKTVQDFVKQLEAYFYAVAGGRVLKKERQPHEITKGTEQTVPLVRFLIGSILSAPSGADSLRIPEATSISYKLPSMPSSSATEVWREVLVATGADEAKSPMPFLYLCLAEGLGLPSYYGISWMVAVPRTRCYSLLDIVDLPTVGNFQLNRLRTPK
jgi:hypothetical protein